MKTRSATRQEQQALDAIPTPQKIASEQLPIFQRPPLPVPSKTFKPTPRMVPHLPMLPSHQQNAPFATTPAPRPGPYSKQSLSMNVQQPPAPKPVIIFQSNHDTPFFNTNKPKPLIPQHKPVLTYR